MEKIMYNKNEIERSYENPKDFDAQAEREGAALKQQGRYTQSRYRWVRLQEEYKQAIEKKYFRKGQNV